jgi:hypothetical protein
MADPYVELESRGEPGRSKDYRELLEPRKHFLEICQDYWYDGTFAANQAPAKWPALTNLFLFT